MRPRSMATTPPAAQIASAMDRPMPKPGVIRASHSDPGDPAREVVAEHDHRSGEDEQAEAGAGLGHHSEVVRCQHVEDDAEADREQRDDPGRGTSLGGQGADLALDPDTLADGVRDVVEDSGEV